MENIVTAISNVGFPIVCCITLARIIYKEYTRIKKQNDELIHDIMNDKDKK